MKLYVNPHEICKIKVYDFRNSFWRRSEATPRTRFLLFFTLTPAQPAGWRKLYEFYEGVSTIEEVLESNSDLVFKDDKVLYKPCVSLVYKTNKTTELTFETLEEAETFVEDLIKKYALTLEWIKDY